MCIGKNVFQRQGHDVKKKKLCEIENSKIHIREIQRRGSGSIESKGEHALNKNRTITQGLEINLRTFE